MTILTTDPNDPVEPIHDRIPVVLPRDEEETWMEAGPDERREPCRPYPDDDLDAYEISTPVNNPGNDITSVIEPVGHEQSGLGIGCRPSGVAAGCLYRAADEAGAWLTQGELADAAGVSAVTVRTHWEALAVVLEG